MPKRRHHHRFSARPFFAPLSAIVLLAFACFPVAVQAETVYDPESTTIPGGTDPSHPTATISSPDGSGGAANGKSGGVSKKGSSADTGSGQGKAGNGSKQGQNQAGQNGQGDTDLSGAAPLGSSSGGDDDGSSSPVVPILIAIAVLAAISMGVVAIRGRRQRRGDPGAQVSPKAG